MAVTSDESLRSHIVAITGPLIRIITDKFVWQARARATHYYARYGTS